jgi:hypothetical protein
VAGLPRLSAACQNAPQPSLVPRAHEPGASVTQPPDPYQQPDPYRGQGPSLYKQPGPEQAGSYQQPSPYGQAAPYQQPSPYGQAGSYQQTGPQWQPGPYQQPSPYQQPWPGYSAQPTGPRNGLGTAGLVLGIVGVVIAFVPFAVFFIWPVPVLAIIFGVMGHNRANHGEATNKTVAIWGWALGAASAIIVPIVSLVIFGFLVAAGSDSGYYNY